MGSTQEQPRVPLSRMLFYGVGQMGAQTFRDTPAVLLPIFMITMLGIPAWIAGLVILLPKAWVLVCDPYLGMVSDRLEPKQGRGPMLLLGAVLATAGFIALFSITEYSSVWLAAVTVCLLYLMAVTGFGTFSVPYLALSGELSTDTHERTKILVFRMFFTVVGVVMGVGLSQPLIHHFGGGQKGWLLMAIVLGGICFVAMSITAIGLWNFRAPFKRGEQASIKEQMKTAWENRPFRWLTIVHFFQSIGQACSYSVVGLIFLYPVGNINLLWIFVLAMSIAGIISHPIWLIVSKKFGKINTFLFSCFGWAAITLTWLFLGAFGDSTTVVPLYGEVKTEELMVVVRAVIIGITNNGFILMAISLLTDAMNYGRKEGDAAREGSFAGVWSASEKLAFAVGPAISGAILSWYGFQASTGGAIRQSDSAINGILLNYSLIPAVIFVISLYWMIDFAKAMKEDPNTKTA